MNLGMTNNVFIIDRRYNSMIKHSEKQSEPEQVVKIIKAATAIKNIQKRRAKLRKQFPKRFSKGWLL